MWNNRNDIAIKQQFRADFRMTPKYIYGYCYFSQE